MTLDPGRLGVPLSLSGAAWWFGRNLLEALIWALMGAVVLVLALTVHNYPQVALWTVLSIVVAGGLVWGLYGARRSKGLASTPSPASVLQFDIFRMTIQVVVATRRDTRQ